MLFKLKPCAQVSVIASPVIEGGQFTLPFKEDTYKMENIMIYNNHSRGGTRYAGSAYVELVKENNE